MSTPTSDKVASPEEKKKNGKEVHDYHQPVLDKLGVSDALFIPKMAYTPSGKAEKHVAFFQSEVSKGKDIFMEFCDKNNVPEYEDRGLYQWKYNSHFAEEYEKTEPHPTTGAIRYLVPVAELTKLPRILDLEFQLNPSEDDSPMNQMTIRDYAAIHMRKPVSTKPWLNELISK